jgi:hypothetical protein
VNNEDLLVAMDIATEADEDLCIKEVIARFDFPLQGNSQDYKVVSYKDGVITLYNPTCTRPLGHE